MEKQLKKFLKTVKLNENTISTILGALVLIVVGVLVYNYFTSLNKGTVTQEANQTTSVTPGEVKIVEENGKQVPQGLPATYEVKKGDNLWKIAEAFYTSGYNWVDIAKENNLKTPSAIEVGQKLTLPKTEVKKVTAKATQPAIDGTTYTTVAGDHLWNIAVRSYGDGYAWTKIYQANKEKIGANPSVLAKNLTLTLPR